MNSSDLKDSLHPQSHESVRRDHSRELAEDYVEAIQQIKMQGTSPRITDLQNVFGVSHVTVIRTLKRLEDQGLVSRSRKDGICLTATGVQLAKQSAKRHQLVFTFLKKLGVSETQARIDAEGLEHHFSEESLIALKNFLKENS